MTVLHVWTMLSHCSGTSSTSINLHSKLSWDSTSFSMVLPCPSTALNFSNKINPMLMPKSPCVLRLKLEFLHVVPLHIPLALRHAPQSSSLDHLFRGIQSSHLHMVHSPLVIPRILQSNSFDHLLERLQTAPTDYSKTNLGGKRIHLQILILSTPLVGILFFLPEALPQDHSQFQGNSPLQTLACYPCFLGKCSIASGFTFSAFWSALGLACRSFQQNTTYLL